MKQQGENHCEAASIDAKKISAPRMNKLEAIKSKLQYCGFDFSHYYRNRATQKIFRIRETEKPVDLEK